MIRPQLGVHYTLADLAERFMGITNPLAVRRLRRRLLRLETEGGRPIFVRAGRRYLLTALAFAASPPACTRMHTGCTARASDRVFRGPTAMSR